MENRRYFIGFVNDTPVSFAPVGGVSGDPFAEHPDLTEVDFLQFYVFCFENNPTPNIFRGIPTPDWYFAEEDN